MRRLYNLTCWIIRRRMTAKEFEVRMRLGDESLGRWNHFPGDNLIHRLCQDSMFQTYCQKGAPVGLDQPLFSSPWRLCIHCAVLSKMPALSARGWESPTKRKRIRRRYRTSTARKIKWIDD